MPVAEERGPPGGDPVEDAGPVGEFEPRPVRGHDRERGPPARVLRVRMPDDGRVARDEIAGRGGRPRVRELADEPAHGVGERPRGHDGLEARGVHGRERGQLEHGHVGEGLNRPPHGARRGARDHDGREGEAAGAQRLDGEERVVERPDLGTRHEHEGEPQAPERVDLQRRRVERDEQPARALDDRHDVVAGEVGGGLEPRRDLRPRLLRGLPGRRRHREPRERRDDLLGGERRERRDVARVVVLRPAGLDGLPVAARLPGRETRKRREQRRRDDGLPDARVGAGDDDAVHADPAAASSRTAPTSLATSSSR